MFSKLKELVGIEEIEEDEEIEEEEEKEKKPMLPRPAAQQPAARPAAAMPAASSKTPQTAGRYTSAQKIVVIEPQGFDESPKLVDSLKAKKPVIINLENLETDTARKIFDFLSGATYAQCRSSSIWKIWRPTPRARSSTSCPALPTR